MGVFFRRERGVRPPTACNLKPEEDVLAMKQIDQIFDEDMFADATALDGVDANATNHSLT